MAKLKLKTQTTKRYLEIWINKKFATVLEGANGKYAVLKVAGREILLPEQAIKAEQKEKKEIEDEKGNKSIKTTAPEDLQILLSLKGDFEYSIKGSNDVVIGADLNDYLWELKKLNAESSQLEDSKDAEELAK